MSNKFIRVDAFFDDINREDCFDTRDMDGISKNFKIVLASDCPANITDCLDDEGTLNKDVTILNTLGEDDGLIALQWTHGINGERSMSITSSMVVYNFPDVDVNIKAAFLVSYRNGSGYVMAYCIDNINLEIPKNKQLIIPISDNVVSLVYGV